MRELLKTTRVLKKNRVIIIRLSGNSLKTVSKWMFQCAYWRSCEACPLINDCRKVQERLEVHRAWIEQTRNGSYDYHNELQPKTKVFKQVV